MEAPPIQATTTGIQHAQRDHPRLTKGREGWAISWCILTNFGTHHEKWQLNMSRDMCLLDFNQFFVEISQVLHLKQKVSLEHPKYCACHAQWTPRTRSKNVDSLTKRALRSSKFTTLNFAPANKNPPAAPLSSTRACSILATCTKYCTCHANENVSCVLRLPHKTPG